MDCQKGYLSYYVTYNLDIMCDKYGLKGLLVGRINCEIPKGCHQLMELTDFMEYSKFIKEYILIIPYPDILTNIRIVYYQVSLLDYLIYI